MLLTRLQVLYRILMKYELIEIYILEKYMKKGPPHLTIPILNYEDKGSFPLARCLMSTFILFYEINGS
jgi:hypothetical protein